MKISNAPRVALVTNVLSHYRVPCFEALAARLPGRIDFFLLTETMAHRNYVLAQSSNTHQFSLQVLPGKAFHRPPFDDLHFNDTRPALRGYDLVILSGWAEPSYILLWSLAKLARKRVGFWIESTLNDGARNTWKEMPKRMMLQSANAVIATGASVVKYCEWLGVSREKIFIAPNAVDSRYFSARAQMLIPQRDQLRAELGLDGVVILFVGRMVDFYKRVTILLDAQKMLQAKEMDAELVLVGEGPDRVAYLEQCQALGLRGVRFVNFMTHDALSRYYAAADIFVLPSRSEVWGLVINEAMEFGLPIVTTRNVGAAPDLVQDNGFVVPPDDAAALAGALEKLVGDALLRETMGARSREIISHFTPDAWADGFANAIERMLE